MLTRCRDFFFTHMGDNWPGFHTRESIATNDCYASFKYTHKLVTNYDFDEFILPRKLTPTRNLARIVGKLDTCTLNSTAFNQEVESNDHTEVPDLANTNLDGNYSLYDHVMELMKRHTKDKVKKIAWLHFEHMLFYDHVADNFFTQLRDAVNSTKNELDIRLNYSNMINTLTYDQKRDSSLARALINLNETIECFNSSLLAKNEKLDQKFNRVYGVWSNARRGKSVFNTDYVEFVNQHFGEQVSERDAVEVRLPLDEGFVNHYREPIDAQFFGLRVPFAEHFRADLESYNFIATLSREQAFTYN